MGDTAILEVSESEGGNCGTPRQSPGGDAISIDMEGQLITNTVFDCGSFD